MKTFKQYLAEQEMLSASTMIERDCAPFLEESQRNGMLRRGIKHLTMAHHTRHVAYDAEGQEVEYAIKQVRQDRRPLDISKQRSKMMDDWFDEKFGIRARSQCVFATGQRTEKRDLAFYGTPCVVFPIGPIEYVWSPKVQDLYSDLDIYFDGKESFVESDADLEERIRRWLDGKGYRTTGLSEAVTMSHEVMIKCSSYYAFPLEYEPQLKQALGIR